MCVGGGRDENPQNYICSKHAIKEAMGVSFLLHATYKCFFLRERSVSIAQAEATRHIL